MLRLALSRAGYFDTAFAESGEAALDLIAQADAPFDCFLLDVNMPNMDGIELCRHIRAHADYADVPIIMVTRLDHRAYVTQAFDAGASDYIVKPFEQAEIGLRVDLARRRSASQQPEVARPALVPVETAASSLSEPFMLRKVPGAVSVEALKNSLQALPSFSRFRICVLKVVNVEELHAEQSLPAFRQTIRQVALILAELLWDEDVQMAYLGDGAIAFAIRGPSDVDCQSLAVSLNDWIADNSPDAQIAPVVAIASDGPPRYIPKLDRMSCLSFARELAEELAEQIIFNASMRAEDMMPRVVNS
ncbi:PleD family two-component system response regulator [Roseivivax sp. THAF40]|nr:response regulator transcription factor [Roseivivax sp. THAF40]